MVVFPWKEEKKEERDKGAIEDAKAQEEDENAIWTDGLRDRET